MKFLNNKIIRTRKILKTLKYNRAKMGIHVNIQRVNMHTCQHVQNHAYTNKIRRTYGCGIHQLLNPDRKNVLP